LLFSAQSYQGQSERFPFLFFIFSFSPFQIQTHLSFCRQVLNLFNFNSIATQDGLAFDEKQQIDVKKVLHNPVMIPFFALQQKATAFASFRYKML